MTRPRRRAPRTLAGAALLALAACHPADRSTVAEGAALAGGSCRVDVKTASLPGGVTETSGAALSRAHPGILWTHEDSGNEPEVVAVDARGALAGRVRLPGARNRDWEDMARGPCGAGTTGDCLYLADIGDNEARHGTVRLYRVPEPAPRDAETAPPEEFRARYPGGPRDAEALAVLPDGAVYVITKGRDTPVEVYRWPTPLSAGNTVTLERLRELAPQPDQPGGMVTAAAASPDGRHVAIRSYGGLAFYRVEDLAVEGARPVLEVDLTPLGEPQGEGLAMGADGAVVLTTEGTGRLAPAALSRLTCVLP